jgi:hypothetical protein
MVSGKGTGLSLKTSELSLNQSLYRNFCSEIETFTSTKDKFLQVRRIPDTPYGCECTLSFLVPFVSHSQQQTSKLCVESD